ncbi:MAG: type VI secretion system baseplate subunit TssE [Rubrivivax sp.]|nr:type VI secretion system baseplate subunit TssE [Rubrivivax sp.]
MATADRQDVLQPSLLDRLIDLAPLDTKEAPADRVLGRQQLRQAVLRDLKWLFNATQPHPRWRSEHPAIAGTALNFGLPPLAGQLASRVDISDLERSIQFAIQCFEPRIIKDTLRVRAIESDSVLDTHNLIEFEISGQMWDAHSPFDILLRTRLDLEAGQVEVSDSAAVSRGS